MLTSEIRARVILSLKAVLPRLTNGTAEHASISSVAEWDSFTTVTFAAALEEEFGIEFAAEDIERLTSFQSALDIVTRARPLAR